MQVRRKIWLIPIFSVFIFIMFTISMVIIFHSSKSVSEKVKLVNEIYLPVTLELSSIKSNLNALQGIFKETVLLSDDSVLDQAHIFSDSIKVSINKIKALNGNISGVDHLSELFENYYSISLHLSKQMLTKKLSDLSNEIGQSSVLVNHLESHLVELNSQVKDKFDENFVNSQQDLNQVTWTIMLMIGLLTALLGGGSFIVVKNLSNRMKRLLVFAQEVEKGNYEYNEVENGSDEFSILMGALNSMASSIKNSTEQLSVLANTDSLTGINNRHSLMQRMNEELHSVRRHEYPLCICMCDIDRFKVINDTHGHQVGDKVIAAFSNCVKEGLRIEDVIGRYGGDEFCIILPHTRIDNAKIAVERIRSNWERREFHNDDKQTFRVTGSFGIAEYHPSLSIEELIKAADDALYESKEAGRNRVSLKQIRKDVQ